MSDAMYYRDTLYGDISLSPAMDDLAKTPIVQRLRDIRLSNIDSLAMPGIANISRYEHALGTAYLASLVTGGAVATAQDHILLGAIGMLHDAGISAFGHLVEEALHYVGTAFDHEAKLAVLFTEPSKTDLGGIDLQIHLGRGAGIQRWAERQFGNDAPQYLLEILEALKGSGRLGHFITSDIDLDNLDNLVRIAYHMGLSVDRALPTRVASRISLGGTQRGPVYADDAVDSIEEWLALRRQVYARLMLSRRDFVGKAMLIYAVIRAYSNGDLGPPDQAWRLTDRVLIDHLLRSSDAEVSQTTNAWLSGELWPLSDLLWFSGDPPAFCQLLAFNDAASSSLDRPCFAYRIADKMQRCVTLSLKSGREVELGNRPERWLLGVTSHRRAPFERRDIEALVDLAARFFETRCLGKARELHVEPLQLF